MGADRLAAALAVAAALVVWAPGRPGVADRLRALPGGQRGSPESSGPTPLGLRSRWSARAGRRLLAAGAGTAVAVFWGGPGGLAAGLVASAGAAWWLRRTAAPAGPPAALVLAEVPVACDLLAVCLEAGTPPAQALAVVAGTVAEPLRTSLRRVAGQHRLGADPTAAWAGVPEVLGPLARVMARAGESGSSVVPALRSLAGELRADARAHTEAAVRRAGVWVLAPLGACFLPAFLCLGVAPLVLGIARDVFR